MHTQSDHKERVVAVSNLEAMCDRVSGTCHRFTVSKVSRSRVHVEYSNPDEYGNETPMTAVFPCYPNPFEAENPFVVLSVIRVIGDNWDGEGWQAFQQLMDCPTLWRSGPDANDWRSHAEIRAAGDDKADGRPDTCSVCDLR